MRFSVVPLGTWDTSIVAAVSSKGVSLLRNCTSGVVVDEGFACGVRRADEVGVACDLDPCPGVLVLDDVELRDFRSALRDELRLIPAEIKILAGLGVD